MSREKRRVNIEDRGSNPRDESVIENLVKVKTDDEVGSIGAQEVNDTRVVDLSRRDENALHAISMLAKGV